jgi:hypothetical protein
MQATRIQTSSQPISQEDLQIPLGRSADPTRIAATCLVLTRDKRLILSLKKKMWCFPNAAELILELNFFFYVPIEPTSLNESIIQRRRLSNLFNFRYKKIDAHVSYEV